MRDVRQLTVKQFRIFPADVVPVEIFPGARGIKPLVETLDFRDARVDEQTGELILVAGQVDQGTAAEGGTRISEVRLGERRIVVAVHGSSADCTAAFEKISALLSGADPLRRLDNSEPILLTQETDCSVELDFEWHKLVSPQLAGFLEEDAGYYLGSQKIQSRLKQMSLRFLFSFSSGEVDVQDLVVLGDKELVIEPRVGVPLSDQRYYTHSPTDSETHFKLLEELERRLSRA